MCIYKHQTVKTSFNLSMVYTEMNRHIPLPHDGWGYAMHCWTLVLLTSQDSF